MDIFTDASLNNRQNVAGVGVVFVPSSSPEAMVCHNSYCFSNNIETAELFAVAMALRLVSRQREGEVRIMVDSMTALIKIKHVFNSMGSGGMQGVDNPAERKIFYSMATSLFQMKNVTVSFQHIKGHQEDVSKYTDAYYNTLADEEAKKGRKKAETVYSKSKQVVPSDMEWDIILEQKNCWKGVPKKVFFLFSENQQIPPQTIARFGKKVEVDRGRQKVKR